MEQLDQRWAFRVAPTADRIVRQAAESAHRTLTEFVVDAALMEAERVLADRTQFVLARAQWDSFVAILDRSPQDNPGLKELFSRPSVFTAE